MSLDPTRVGRDAGRIADEVIAHLEGLTCIPKRSSKGPDEAGWAFVGAVGNYLTKIQPDFDQRLYGCQKLSEVIRKYPDVFETSERGAPG